MPRFIWTRAYTASLGAHSVVIDTKTSRRILLGGADHEVRAERRAEQEEAKAAAAGDQPERPGCPPGE